MNILALLQPIQNSVSKTTMRQLSRIIPAMISMTGRMTMLGLSRWTDKGGSYRTVQRFFYTVIPWAKVFWAFFVEHLLDREEIYLLAGDECVVTKAGGKTFGLDYFFSGLLKKVVPGLSRFSYSPAPSRFHPPTPVRTLADSAPYSHRGSASISGSRCDLGQVFAGCIQLDDLDGRLYLTHSQMMPRGDLTVSRLCFVCRLPFGRRSGRFCVSF